MIQLIYKVIRWITQSINNYSNHLNYDTLLEPVENIPKKEAVIPQISEYDIKVLEPEDILAPLIKGLKYAESRDNDKYKNGGNPNLIGDKNIPESEGGPAFGCLQIRSGVRSQVNNLWKTNYKGIDLLGEEGAILSEKMCRAYFEKIVPQYINYKFPLFKVSDIEFFARAWNGGIGWQKNYGKKGYERYTKGLDDYWKTVQTHMT